MSEVYKLFAQLMKVKNLSYTEEDAIEVYLWESTGRGSLKAGVFPAARADGTYNGYAIGKIWKDWQVTEWKDSINKRLLFVFELYEDDIWPKWWLGKIFKGERI